MTIVFTKVIGGLPPEPEGVTVGSFDLGGFSGYGYNSEGTYTVEGGINPEPLTVSGNNLYRVYGEQLGTAEWHVIFDGVHSQTGLFSNLNIEARSEGTFIDLDPASASDFSDDGVRSHWVWNGGGTPSSENAWTSSEVGELRQLEFTEAA